jgi:hypothetical protein
MWENMGVVLTLGLGLQLIWTFTTFCVCPAQTYGFKVCCFWYSMQVMMKVRLIDWKPNSEIILFFVFSYSFQSWTTLTMVAIMIQKILTELEIGKPQFEIWVCLLNWVWAFTRNKNWGLRAATIEFPKTVLLLIHISSQILNCW